MCKNTVCVLLATYNGEAFLDEQLQSLMDQTYKNIHIWVQDDGSTDGTVEILQKWQMLFPGKFIISRNETNLHGACANFMDLAKKASGTEYDWFMFCDQDDIWKPDKIEQSFNLAMQDFTNVPLLVHTDLELVDAKGRLLAESMKEKEHIRTNGGLNTLLLQNWATGCTFLFNHKLLELAAQAGETTNIKMHDWWFLLYAKTLGTVLYLDRPTIQYRQHKHNAIGAKPVTFKEKWQKNVQPMESKDFYAHIDAFYRNTKTELKPEDQRLIAGFLDLKNHGRFYRWRFALWNKIQGQNILATFGKVLAL